jgi:hypothetical protein
VSGCLGGGGGGGNFVAKIWDKTLHMRGARDVIEGDKTTKVIEDRLLREIIGVRRESDFSTFQLFNFSELFLFLFSF